MLDEWNGFAVLLAELMEKHAADLDIDALPAPPPMTKDKEITPEEKLETALAA